MPTTVGYTKVNQQIQRLTMNIQDWRDYPFHKVIPYFPANIEDKDVEELMAIRKDLDSDVFQVWKDDEEVEIKTDDIHWTQDVYYYAYRFVGELLNKKVPEEQINMQHVEAGL